MRPAHHSFAFFRSEGSRRKNWAKGGGRNLEPPQNPAQPTNIHTHAHAQNVTCAFSDSGARKKQRFSRKIPCRHLTKKITTTNKRKRSTWQRRWAVRSQDYYFFYIPHDNRSGNEQSKLRKNTINVEIYLIVSFNGQVLTAKKPCMEFGVRKGRTVLLNEKRPKTRLLRLVRARPAILLN